MIVNVSFYTIDHLFFSNSTPPRPAGTRQEPRPNRVREGETPGVDNSFVFVQNFGFGEGVNFQMSFGVGAFPFGLFQTTFNTNNTDLHYRTRTSSNRILQGMKFCRFLAQPGTPERQQHDLLSRIFLGIAVAVLLFILFN